MSAKNDKIPARVELVVCEKCGRTDRFTSVGSQRHFMLGKVCGGRLVKAHYIFESQETL